METPKFGTYFLISKLQNRLLSKYNNFNNKKTVNPFTIKSLLSCCFIAMNTFVACDVFNNAVGSSDYSLSRL